MKLMIITIMSLFLVAFISVANAQIYYIAPNGNDQNSGDKPGQPFATIQKAVDEVRKSDTHKTASAKPALIYMLGGTYELKQPVIINPSVQGSSVQPIVVNRYQNQPVVVSGGREIKGWKKEKNGWLTTTIPEVAAGEWKFRQLYVNGASRPRARKPNNGFLIVRGMPEGTPKTADYHKDCQSFEFAKGDINPKWKNLDDVEVIVYHFWTDSHLPIQSIDEKTNLITFKHKAGKVFTDDFTENGARYIVENVYEELDAPGEWYLDRKTGKLSYYPFPDEQPGQMSVYAPVLPELIRFEGDPENQKFVENITFRNIEFRFTNFELPKGNSNDRQGSASVTSAITLKGARNCEFSNCTVSQIGNWAFELADGCSSNLFKSNKIFNTAAGGFRVNGGSYNQSPFLRTRSNSFTDNEIHHYGELYPSAVGILLQQTEENLVAHNLIHHGYYTGVSIGWEWGYQRSVSRDNVIEFNHIHHIGQGLLSDMGAIYTLGVSPGTVIRNNLIHDVDANHYGGWGIYHDEGSTHILDENNIVYNTKFAGFNIHFCKEVTVRNNIFALGRLQQLSRGRVEPHKSVYFENNIVYWKEGKLLDGNWKDQPYTFYFHPKNKEGTREITETFDMDRNLYFNPAKKLNEIDFNGKSLIEWQKGGKDTHSVFADPLFVDVDNFDFRLKPGSPAFQLGFKNIDMSNVGPREPTGPLQSKVIP